MRIPALPSALALGMLIIVPISAIPFAPAVAQNPSANPCATASNSPYTLIVREGATATSEITGFRHVGKASPSPAAALGHLADGTKIISGSYVVQNDDGSQYQVTVKASPRPTAQPGSGTIAAQTVPATPAPMPTAISGLGPVGQINATIRESQVATIVSASPVPIPSTSPGGRSAASDQIAVVYTIKGVQAGRAILYANDGVTCYRLPIVVKPSAQRFIVSTGFGVSNIPVNSYTSSLVTPAPAGSPPPSTPVGFYVYHTERSAGQAFVPVLASFRVTDAANQYNFFATAGLSASGATGSQLYGISVGNEQFLLTVGEHTAQYDALTPGLAVGRNRVGALAPGAPLTYKVRTTRPFVSVTAPLCQLAQILSAVTGGCGTSGNANGSSSSTTSTSGQ